MFMFTIKDSIGWYRDVLKFGNWQRKNCNRKIGNRKTVKNWSRSVQTVMTTILGSSLWLKNLPKKIIGI